MKTRIIIVNYNCYPYILDCLTSLDNASGINLESVVIVDNASTDNSIYEIKRIYKQINIIKNQKNLGFAKAVNIGINSLLELKQKPEYILLLNPDVQVHKLFFKPLIETFGIKTSVGIVSPIIKDIGKNRFALGLKFNHVLGKVTHKHVGKPPRNIIEEEMVSGCSIMIKKNVFEKIGLFDEKFFLFFEDADFCLRAKKAGFEIYTQPRSQISHLISKSMLKDINIKNTNIVKSNFLFILKHIHFYYWPLSFAYLILLILKILINNFLN